MNIKRLQCINKTHDCNTTTFLLQLQYYNCNTITSELYYNCNTATVTLQPSYYNCNATTSELQLHHLYYNFRTTTVELQL